MLPAPSGVVGIYHRLCWLCLHPDTGPAPNPRIGAHPSDVPRSHCPCCQPPCSLLALLGWVGCCPHPAYPLGRLLLGGEGGDVGIPCPPLPHPELCPRPLVGGNIVECHQTAFDPQCPPRGPPIVSREPGRLGCLPAAANTWPNRPTPTHYWHLCHCTPHHCTGRIALPCLPDPNPRDYRAGGENRRNPAAAANAGGAATGRGEGATPRQGPQSRATATARIQCPDPTSRQPAGPRGPGTNRATAPPSTATKSADPPTDRPNAPHQPQQPATRNAHPPIANPPTRPANPAGRGGRGAPPPTARISGLVRLRDISSMEYQYLLGPRPV